MKAVWQDVVVAESDDVKVIEGDYYFPLDSIKKEYFVPSTTRSMSPREGEAHYYDIVISGAVNKDAAWYFPEPSPEAPEVAGYIAFWKGVKVIS